MQAAAPALFSGSKPAESRLRAGLPNAARFPNSGRLHKLWGGPPGPRPAIRAANDIESQRRAGPGGPARTRGSAPLKFCSAAREQKPCGITAGLPAPREVEAKWNALRGGML